MYLIEREIIVINREKCNGCGNCIPSCPKGAMKLEKKEATPFYDEKKTIENIIKHRKNITKAH